MILTCIKLISLPGQTLVFGESNQCVWQSKLLGSIRRRTVFAGWLGIFGGRDVRMTKCARKFDSSVCFFYFSSLKPYDKGPYCKAAHEAQDAGQALLCCLLVSL